ncbi:MAG: M23 family metallopeptidase, partial [Spirochaetes bacterium]|nr:M23 family metallopeptidase [Spirochaetota bacterium]
GEPITIAVGCTDEASRVSLIVGGQRLARSSFFAVPAKNGNRGFKAAIITVPATARPGDALIRIECPEATLTYISFSIAQRDFVSEVIHLTPVLTGIRTDASPQRSTEINQLWAILNRTGTDVFATEGFMLPVSSTRRTSIFGSRRVFMHSDGRSDTSIHAGVDFGVPTGTHVYASAPGRVMLARSRIVTGMSVIIEHLPGVYSLYYHLSQIDVAEGDIIEAGTLLGLSGATGLATGPHLHWEVRVSGENTDPDALVARNILDIPAILDIIGN